MHFVNIAVENSTRLTIYLSQLNLFFFFSFVLNFKNPKIVSHFNVFESKLTTNIILLGTGTPIIDPDRMGPSLSIQYGREIVLFDAGPGLIRRAKKANLNPETLKVIFLSHLHSDHTAGLPDFMYTPSVEGRPGPVKIYGPSGTQEMINNIKKAYSQDVQIRVNGYEQGKKENYDFEVIEIEDGKTYVENHIQILPFLVEHGEWPSFGFRITTPDRIIVYSGDTKPCKNIIKYSRECDVLIHEVYSSSGLREKSIKWQNYHTHMHTSAIELAQIANKIQPDLLILTHQIFWNTSEKELLYQITNLYEGRVVSGHDLDVF